ncbi:hypothetical protein FQZ97_989030 [compost metagenome]
MVDIDVAADRQAFALGLAHQLQPGGGGQAAQVHAGAGGAHQFEDGMQAHGLGDHGYAGQAEARCDRAAGGHAAAQERIFRA